MTTPHASLQILYRVAYALVVELNENGDALVREARLRVMEAFNELAESPLEPPTSLPAESTRAVDQALGDLQIQLTEMLAVAPTLEEALRFNRCRELIRAAAVAKR